MVFPFDILRRIFKNKSPDGQSPARPEGPLPPTISRPLENDLENTVRRHFYNNGGFQTYASFFRAWEGWVTAAHVLDESMDALPPFAQGRMEKWPAGLDAALLGCDLPKNAPNDPVPGQAVNCIGYPAGSAHAARREAKIYMERPGKADTWIAHILTPDEPVVTGMSGGVVLDAITDQAIGIIITRNSPADLNADRDPDESFDFVSLAGVWRAVHSGGIFV